jgi:hypothetical protein
MADETEEASDPKADAETRSVAPFIDDEDDDAIADAEPTEAESEDGDGEDGGDETPSKAAGTKGAKDTTGTKAAKDAKDGKAADADRTVVRRQVTSKRVTPKGGPVPVPKKSNSGNPSESSRYTPPGQGAYAKGPSPWWVPALMFGLLIIGAAIIMTNYMGVFGDASNVRLIIGLGFILGGIVTATQYR